jgi:hypothetical protein
MRAKEALTRLQMEKRLAPYLCTTQSQPHRTFLVHQNLRRPLLPRQPPRRRIGLPQRRTTSRPSLADHRTRPRRKTHQPRSDRLQRQPMLSLFTQPVFASCSSLGLGGKATSLGFHHFLTHAKRDGCLTDQKSLFLTSLHKRMIFN